MHRHRCAKRLIAAHLLNQYVLNFDHSIILVLMLRIKIMVHESLCSGGSQWTLPGAKKGSALDFKFNYLSSDGQTFRLLMSAWALFYIYNSDAAGGCYSNVFI